MENKEIQEITVEKELPKTLEEYVIKEIESLKKMNADLAEALRISRALNFKQNEEIETLKNKYNELVNRLKKDLKPRIEVAHNKENKYITLSNSHLWDFEDTKEIYEYYKNLFNLKEEEEGEEDDE